MKNLLLITSLLLIVMTANSQSKKENWELFEANELVQEREDLGRSYLRFLDRKSMSMGIYELPVGADDKQQPHDEDEVYYVLGGKGDLIVEEDKIAVKEGSIVFVAANKKHKFVNIEETLTLLVFFSTGPVD